MKIALAQMTASDDPAENLDHVLAAMRASDGADILFTPEVTNCVSLSRDHQQQVLEPFEDNSLIQAVADQAKRQNLWVALGSIAVKTDDPDGRFANRSVLIDGSGQIHATYDKIHMFDVTLSDTESYHESRGYRPGDRAVVADTPWATLGLSICYDLRFPHLYADLAKAGARVLLMPSAFSVPTGTAHWHTLLRARAIETGCFVIAAAQTGTHTGSGRKTFGHSLVVDPWGRVLLDAGAEVGVHFVDLDLSAVDTARQAVPSLSHVRPYFGPDHA